jgi:hypothetical protein
MIAPGVSNGGEGPKSRTKPVFLDELCHLTVVPIFTQKGTFGLAFVILGVAEAELPPRRLMSTVQGTELDPHVFSALHMLSGCGSEQIYFLLLRCSSWAAMKPTSRKSGKNNRLHQIAKLR